MFYYFTTTNQAMLSQVLLQVIYLFASGDLDIFDVKDRILRALPTGISDSIIEKILEFINIAAAHIHCKMDDDNDIRRAGEDVHGMGGVIHFRDNHFCIYVYVPPRHALFGKHHDDINIGATYSGTSARGWWAFGWDYGHRYCMTIENLCRLIDAGDFEAIDRLETYTTKSFFADIKLRFNQMNEAHLRITGSPYTRTPGSSQRNKKNRKRGRRRKAAAGPFQRAYWS